MIVQGKKLKRRTFLRGVLGGAVVSVGLPALEIMLDDHGQALADGGELPTRFGVWFWGNGVRPEQWTPSGGAGWNSSHCLPPTGTG